MAHSKMLSTLALCATSVLLLVCAQRAVAVAGPGDPFSCSFDKGGLCQWSTEGKPGVSTWAFGIPENSNIGPLSAPADGKGGTIYVNETILANGKHKQVKLSSRVVGEQKEAACFTFWYHMFAGHGTELALYQISARKTDGKEDSRELFKHSGRTTVDRWQQVRLSVQLGRKRNQLRFSAALASKEHASVIALGPFDYTQGTCDVLTDANGYCDFEFDECGWTSTGGWKRGARPSTLDDRDHYVRSGPVNSAQVLMAANKEGQSVIVAIVTSPKLQGKREPQCLEFWYTVMGPRGAELRAEIPVDNKTEVIWKKRPTSDWMLARVQLVKSKPFQVTFRAALPAKKRSVVSIDDVAVRPEPCLPSANCEFVEGICGYVNKFRQDVRWLVGAGRLEEPERLPSVPIPQGAFSSFAYLDLSSQDVSESDPVKTVGLLSPFFDIVDDQTMIVLQYFRHGPDITEANMSVSCYSDDTTKKTQTLYSAELDEVTEWSELTVALKPGSNCQLAVWVTTGGSTNGAMAIHSVKVQQQATSSPAIEGSATHCTFDEGTMCGWTSDGGAMTWTLNNPANKVPNYPRFDHTMLAYKGGFIFADNKKSSEKTAVLKSPTLNLNSADGACFSFWHFAQHKFMGNITVHSGKQILFTTSTRASHRWQHALAQFNGTADRLELEIRASIGRGLIALDDLRITDEPCPQSDFCSWQEESLCLVNQDPGNIVPWVRREAIEVGVPDHTLNNLEGYYLYVNTTALDSHHPRSRVFLQRREPTEATCVTFWWRGQGSPSQLNVYRFTKETALRDPLLSMSTSSAGDWWNARTVTVTSANPWNLVFEVVAPEREKSQSGVMVDDVEFADGQCPPYNLCTFENECLPWQIPTTEGSDANFEVERAGSFKMLPRDHSTATEDGYYLLYRSSGIKGNRTTLQLREPSRYACSSLWYFVPPMSGGVSLLLQSESLDGKNKTWNKKQFRLSKQSGDAPIQVVSGSERQSFVAIDDILVSEEDCQDTGKLPSPDFKCGGKMVPMDRICDFVPDCKDGSDERRCGDCDFRKDACGWNLDDVRNQGSTTWKVVPVASVQPSPPTRMNGQRDGKYLLLFTNSSGFPKSNRAIIESPKIRNTNKLCTLMFWFYYASNGDLVDAELSMTVASYAVTVWSLRTAREMSREKVWNQAVVEVGRYATELSFHFSANKTGEGRSEFAVAGIQYRDCALPTKTRECTVGEFRCGNGVCVEPRDRCNYVDDCGDNTDEEGCGDYRLGCNFDSSFCDWTPLPPQDNVGTPWKLATPSSSLLSGPTRDHTTGTPDGRFIILHSRSFKNAATIVGPTLDPSMPCSITFFYTIQGGSAHQLSLHIRTSKNGPWKQVWIDVDRNQFFHFIVGHSELLASKPYQVAFKGEYRKHGERGYIAIDDVTFSPSCLAYHGELPETPTQQPPSPTAPSELPALPTTTPAPRTQPPFACRENEFQCGSIEECVPLSNVCDFKDHCSNGADEAKCGACEFTRDLCGLENEEPNARFGWTWKATQDAAHSRHFPTADSRNNTYGSYAAYSLINDDMPADRVVNSMITPRLGPIGHSCVVNFYVNTGGMSAVLTFGVLPPSEETTVVLATAYVKKLQSEWTLVSVKTGNWDGGARFSYSTDTVGVSVDRPRYVNCHPDSQSEGAEATAQVSCDFSRPQECGWFPERRTADIAWSVHSDGAHLPSHTWQPSDSASGNGAYMYAENNLRGVKKAHLVSIRMSPTTNLGRCFTFWYNMWHPNSGDLNLLQRVDNVSSSLVWTRSGPQGKEWQEGQVQLVSDEPHQLVFEAVLKPGIPGVIAIDHFTLKDGRCDSGKVCTFESGSCGWELHNWEVTKGRSAVLPPSDHSTWAPSGSFARVLPPNGRMVSPQGWYDATQQRCLRFWFFMAGSAAETLNVTRVTDSVLEESLWFRTADGTTENSWHSAAVNVTGAQGKIATAFEGATSGDPGTAVAVDDISLGAEACPKPGSCSFEEDMCNWHNNKGFKYAQWYRHKGRTILSGGGLDKDHTKGTADGYYLLLDFQDQSDILIGSLQSETLALGPAVCFQLYYYMKSGTQASLNVTFGDASGLASDPPTTVYATGPAEWTLLSVERDNVPGTFSVMITATAGKLAEDVAIDDIDIWAGKCQNALETSTTSQSTIETAASVEPSTTATTDAPVTAIGTTASVEPSTTATTDAPVTAIGTTASVEPSTTATTDAPVTAIETAASVEPSTTATTDAPVTAIGTTASVEPSTPSTTGVPETAIGTTVSEEPSRTSTTYAPVTEQTTLPTEESTLKTESTTPSSTDSPSETFTTEETTLTTETTTTPVTEVPSQTSLQCSYGQFSCGDDVTCIQSLLRCDGVKDCPNGHDEDCETENICKESEFYCPSRSPSECLPQAFLCDGYDDCAGGADESLCEVCPEYLCLNGATCSWTREQRTPVCNCSDSYKGSRCQLRATGVQAEQQDKLKAAGSSGTAIVSSVIVLALVAIAVAITVVIIKRRRAAQNPRLLYNAASYDVTTEETAFRD